MTGLSSVVVTGTGIEIPGIATSRDLLDVTAGLPIPGAFAPEERLQRKGLRYKDHATRLALCAARAALLDARLPTTAAEQGSPERFGVVVSSNLGNVDTVCRVAGTISESGVDGTSPMDLPNASSNVPAATVAIWYGLKGPNLMVCNGATSGTDALYTAANAIRAGRADRMLVIGVEPANPVTQRLMSASLASAGVSVAELRLMDGAGAVVLESAAAAAERAGEVRGILTGYGYDATDSLERSLSLAEKGSAGAPGVWLVPGCGYAPTAERVANAHRRWGGAAPRLLALGERIGEAYGALGVLQCIAACEWLRANGGGTAIATSGATFGDGSASLRIAAPSVGPAGGSAVAEPASSTSGRRSWERVHPAGVVRAIQAGPDSPATSPTVVFVHGMEEGWEVWQALQAGLPHSFRLVSLDLPWSGRTDYRDAFSREAREWISDGLELVPGGADYVVAHSFGSNALLEHLSARGTGTLKGIVLIAPFYKGRAEDLDWALLRHYVDRFQDLMEDGIRVRLAARQGDATLASAMAEKVRDRIGPYGWTHFFLSLGRTPSLDLAPIRKIPCLIIGGAHDFASFPRDCEELASNHGNATVTILPDCGHFCMLDNPSDVSRLIERFVRATHSPL